MTDFAEVRLTVGGRELSLLCHQAIVSMQDEQRYLGVDEARQYGMVLWPAAIALALEIAGRAREFRGARVLELGAGVGLPGIVAATCGARVLQTDRDPDALDLCRRNAERNGATTETRVADWTAWDDAATYDWIIASDVTYRTTLHDELHAILRSASAAGGRALISDPMRPTSLPILYTLEETGWSLSMNKWAVGEGEAARKIAVYDLGPPRA